MMWDVAPPSEWVALLETVMSRVPNIDQATIAVHKNTDFAETFNDNPGDSGSRNLGCVN